MSLTVYTPGPLYPDLFDGATPIMVPTEFEDLAVFRVRTSWIARDYDIIDVIAPDEDEAERVALAETRRIQDLEDIEADVIRRLRDATPDEAITYAQSQAIAA